jgi:hypothetical protein
MSHRGNGARAEAGRRARPGGACATRRGGASSAAANGMGRGSAMLLPQRANRCCSGNGEGPHSGLNRIHHVLEALRAALIGPLLLALGDRPQPSHTSTRHVRFSRHSPFLPCCTKCVRPHRPCTRMAHRLHRTARPLSAQ